MSDDMKVLVFDCDYDYNRKGDPVIRLYGRKLGGSKEGDNIILQVLGFEPYFYCEGISEEDITGVAGEYIKRVEKVVKYRPIGYQVDKFEMFKVVLYNPRVTPEVRELIEKIDGIVYEADILFKNRFMIDSGINGMSVIEFNEIGKELGGYGLNCEELYIIEKEDIRVSNEVVSIEY